MGHDHDHGHQNFGAATDYRPFAARLNRSGSGFTADAAADRCVQVGLIGRTYRLTVAEAADVVRSLRKQLDRLPDRVRVVIPGCPYTRPGSSSGNRRAATRGEAASLIRDLEAAISASGVTHTGKA